MRRALLIGLLLIGCADPPGPEQDAGLDVDAAPVARAFQLAVTYAEGATPPAAPLRVLAEPLNGPGQVLIDLADTPTDGTFTIDALDPGPWRLTVFVDRADDGEFDACPFPPTAADPLVADRLDNHHGVWTGSVGAGALIPVTVERHLCGPGGASTGLTGTLELPADVDHVDVPLLLQLTPQDGGPPLRLPLFPEGVQARRTGFSLGSLLPGTYAITVFSDDDADGRPSPCGPALGGGDRWLAQVPEGGGGVVVEAGSRRMVSLALRPAPDCPDALTGLAVTLQQDPSLFDALGALEDPSVVLEGGIWVGLVPPTGGAPVASTQLVEGVGALPITRWLTGVEPGPWTVVAWIDRDRDSRFSPCGGLAGGLDAVSARAELVQVSEGRVRPLELTMGLGDCNFDLGGVTGEVRVPRGTGAVASGRPVRLDLADEAGARQLSVQLFDNHWRMAADGVDQVGRFALGVELPPGQYTGTLYLDTDRDGRFVRCDAETGFGDRTSTRDAAPSFDAVPLSVTPGRLTDLGTVTMREHACPVPDTTIGLTIVAGAGPSEPAAPLRLRIDELGGWHDDLAAAAAFDPVEGAEFTVPRRGLPPGRYRLTAYLDTDGDGAFDDCDAEIFDEWVGRVEVELGLGAVEIDPYITLEPACGR